MYQFLTCCFSCTINIRSLPETGQKIFHSTPLEIDLWRLKVGMFIEISNCLQDFLIVMHLFSPANLHRCICTFFLYYSCNR